MDGGHGGFGHGLVGHGGFGRGLVGHGRAALLVGALAVVAILAGCTSPVVGSAEKAPYRPIPLASMTAHPAVSVDGAIAYSPDGRRVAVGSQHTVCIGPARPGPGSDRPVCASLGTTVGRVLFSPDGATVAAVEDFHATFRGRLWLISAATGRATPVPTVDLAGTGTAGSGKAGETGKRGETGTARASSRSVPYVSIAWPGNGTLLALALDTTGKKTHLVEVDGAEKAPHRPIDRGAVDGGSTLASGFLLAGAGIALVPVQAGGRGVREWVLFDGRSHAMRTLRLTGDVITADPQVLPLAIAPDGRSAVAWAADPVTYRQWPPVRVDLATGRVATIEGSGKLDPNGAAYSPDGTQLMLLAQGAHGDVTDLVVMPATGGTPRTLARLDAGTVPGTGLDWTPANLLVPYVTASSPALNGMAPIRLTG